MLQVNRPNFFAYLRNNGIFGPSLSQDEVDGCNAILDATQGWGLSWVAYALATAYRETGSTMHPIKEYGGNAYYTRMYDVTGSRPTLARSNGNISPGDGPKYCGRGYVQLTWRNNYLRAGTKLGIDLVNHPDRAMELPIAARIMRYGMEEGWFTGKKLADYLPKDNTVASYAAFLPARRIINGIDHTEEIAGHAVIFQRALVA